MKSYLYCMFGPMVFLGHLVLYLFGRLVIFLVIWFSIFSVIWFSIFSVLWIWFTGPAHIAPSFRQKSENIILYVHSLMSYE